MPSVTDQIRSRWNDTAFKKFTVARASFDSVLAARDRIDAKRAELAKDVSLSDVGRRQKLTEFSKTEAKHIAKAQRAIAHARDSIADRKRSLLPKGDAAKAAFRQEIRAALKTMGRNEIARLVNDPAADIETLVAISEAPSWLSGVDAGTKQQLLDLVVERIAPKQLEAIQDETEALDLVNAAIRVAGESVRDPAGIQHGMFESWLNTTCPPDANEAAAAAAAAERARLLESYSALPTNERMALIDQLIATNAAAVKAA